MREMEKRRMREMEKRRIKKDEGDGEEECIGAQPCVEHILVPRGCSRTWKKIQIMTKSFMK